MRHCDLNAALDVQQEARLYTAGMLDLGDYSLLETVKKLPGDEFVVVHDESKFLRKQREFWEAVFSQANPPAVLGWDRRTIEFPLPVKELHLEDSKKFPQLQVADLIASAARAHANGYVVGMSTFP